MLQTYKSRKPNYEEELELIKSFVKETYPQELQEIANRQRVLLSVQLDDLAQYNGNEGRKLVSNLERNAYRYIQLFSSSVDAVLPEANVDIVQPDVYDILMRHRLDAHQQQQQHLSNETQNSDPFQNVHRSANSTSGNQSVSSQHNNQNTIPTELKRRYEIRFKPRQAQRFNPTPMRQIRSQHLGRLVTVRGIVTRLTDVKSKVLVATYTCEECGEEVYQEVTSKDFMPLLKCPGERCRMKKVFGRLVLQSRGSKFIKFQELKLQEMSNEVPMGNIPRTMRVFMHGELTRQCSPGDTVTLAGAFLPQPVTGLRAMRMGPVSDTYIEGMYVEKMKMSFSDYSISNELWSRIQHDAANTDFFSRLANSIAPEIYGHEDVKKALLLQLVGGVTRTMSDGMCIRGDLHLCLMGDPGVAKSQLLKYASMLSPRGIYTTGKGSSGVGLTAAVIKDKFTGELVLEGGALVLADMGVCCIDEFDKMDEMDRTAIHEVMEQQTVSIAKAGITTSLNARSAVLAAANPSFGRYNTRRTVSENINLPAALLSRFDLLFLILDRRDETRDMELARHVTHVHRYEAAPHARGGRRYNHDGDDIDDGNTDEDLEPYSTDFLRAVIAHAKTFNPSVPPSITSYLTEHYVEMRKDESRAGADADSYTTPRTLLSILRLSQALARLRFRGTVTQADIDEALRLMKMSKISLVETEEQNKRMRRDPISEIYDIIKDQAIKSRSISVRTGDAMPIITSRGFRESDLRRCLREYESLDVWQVDDDGEEVHFLTSVV